MAGANTLGTNFAIALIVIACCSALSIRPATFPCPLPGCAPPPPNCHYVEAIVTGPNGCPTCGTLVCPDKPIKPCIVPVCAAPPPNCHYTNTVGPDGCPVCGDLVCDKPVCFLPPCAPPPPGCDYIPGKDENGCPTCGTLKCECPFERVCTNECPRGNVVGSNGCKTCLCKAAS